MTNEPDKAELIARLASSFGSTARDYADHRPDYPAAGIDWILAGSALEVREVIDLAAGTGALTRGLLGAGLDVTAVEPDEQMLAELTRRLPDVRALAGTAEEVPLPSASVDAVFVGQAFHWFDADAALTEIARVLRPGGVLGMLWNRDDETVPWVAELGRLSRTTVTAAWSGADPRPVHPLFSPIEEKRFPHAQRRTAASLTATVGTHSQTLVVTPAERAAVLDRVQRFLETHPETSAGEFDLPITTLVLRSTRIQRA